MNARSLHPLLLALLVALGSALPWTAACSDPAAPPLRPAGGRGGDGAATLDIPEDAPKVVFLGDSLAAGLHLAADESFPAVLQRDLAERGEPFELVNAGVSGDTTAGGLNRLDWLLDQDPDVLVVELGGNDGLRGQPIAAIAQNLRSIVLRAQEEGVRVLLLGVQLPPNYGEEYTRAFERMYVALAEETGASLVPRFMEGVGGVAELNLEDGLHPTAEGHRLLARNVAPGLRALLEELRP